jgi:protein-disulfide isomerase
MNIDRRIFLTGAVVVAAGAGGYYVLEGSSENASKLPGVSDARAQDADNEKLLQAPGLGERVLGSPDAKVTLIEYASATCPHCADFHARLFPTLKTEFIDTGKVKFIFREFPLDDLALAAFMVARCAPADKYFPMLDVLFEQQKTWVSNDPREALFKIAQMAGFSRDSFDKCLKDEKTARGVIDIKERGEKEFGVSSTPTFFINGKVIQGVQPIEDFRKAIEDALAA